MKRITIYDKGKEMKKASNLRFAQDYGIVGEFDNICRLEMNLNQLEFAPKRPRKGLRLILVPRFSVRQYQHLAHSSTLRRLPTAKS